MTGFRHDIAGGNGNLVVTSLQSPDFVHEVSGWQIAKNGSAEFNNVTIRGGESVDGVALYYSPTPGAGNLVASVANTAGTDKYGNAYVAGDASYFGGPPWKASSIYAGSVIYYDALTEAGPWSEIATFSFQLAYPVAGFIMLSVGGASGIAPGDLMLGNSKDYWYSPSNDVSGISDASNIQNLLNAGLAVHLLNGRYYVDSTINIPQGAVLTGIAKSGLGLNSVQTIISPTVAMDAVVASTGWLTGANTTAQETVTLRDFKIYDPSGFATHGVVTQNYDSLFSNLEIQGVTGDGLRFDAFDQSGVVQITTTGVNNRVYGCTFQNCGRGFATNEAASGAAVFTDGFLTDCIIANASGVAGIAIQRCAGWKVTGNHLYGLAKHGIQAGQMFATNITDNYIETWGTTATAGTYRAIDGASIGQSDDGPASVIAGNRIDMFAAPGNAATNLEGISILCDASNHANFSVVGNGLFCEPSTGWATAHACEYANAASTSILLIASTGNMITGNWSAQIVQVPNGGTITLTAGS